MSQELFSRIPTEYIKRILEEFRLEKSDDFNIFKELRYVWQKFLLEKVKNT